MLGKSGLCIQRSVGGVLITLYLRKLKVKVYKLIETDMTVSWKSPCSRRNAKQQRERNSEKSPQAHLKQVVNTPSEDDDVVDVQQRHGHHGGITDTWRQEINR